MDRTFEHLYRRHVAHVYRYTLAVLDDQADAEGVTQTTFRNAYRAIQRGEQADAAHAWLIAIAHDVCRQRFRQSGRRPTEPALVEDAAGAGDIRRALSYLAFDQRSALVMRDLEGRSYAEIAEILALSTSEVETILFSARRTLREQLERAIACEKSKLAISKQLDGRLARAERNALRAHLGECSDCASFARLQLVQRAALKALGAVPLPVGLCSPFGGGTTAGVALAASASPRPAVR